MKRYIQDLQKNKKFYLKLLILTLPIVLQSLVTSSLNMLDTLMIGKLGAVPLASVGIANQFYFLFTLFVLGIAGGCGVLVAQLWGKKDSSNIRRILARSLIYALVIALIFIGLGILFSQNIIAFFNNDNQVVKLGSSYLSITVFSYFFTAITLIYASTLRSIGNTKLPMLASIIGLITNGLLNYMLIFGNFNMPSLGTQGAGIATLIARIIECAIVIAFVYLGKEPLKLALHDFKVISKHLQKTLSAITLPILINEACWGIGNITYIAIYARMGTYAAASIQICSTIMNLFMVFTFGLASASVVIIGNEIGAGNKDLAIDHSKKISGLALAISLILGLLMFAFASPLTSFFNVADSIKQISTYILYVYALVMAVKVYNIIMIVGILRGGGDARFGSILQAFTLWCIGIPLTLIAANIIRLPLYWVVSFIIVEEVVKFTFLRKRYKSQKWINDIIGDPVEDASPLYSA